MKTVFDVLASKYEEEIGALKEHAGKGNCANYAEYQLVCGQIRGLTTALHMTKDLAKQQMDDDDDE